VTTGDPTLHSRWRPLFLLLRRLDADIEELYVQAGFTGVSSRHVLPLVRLAHRGPLTIRGLAEECQVSHSAMSQTVAAMSRSGFVETQPDPSDGRARLVALTALGREVAALGEVEWRATEAVVAELEAETSSPLSEVVREIEAALERRDFGSRLHEQLGRARPGDA
jgi:DNA-binding MarR family transcriptional regulator